MTAITQHARAPETYTYEELLQSRVSFTYHPPHGAPPKHFENVEVVPANAELKTVLLGGRIVYYPEDHLCATSKYMDNGHVMALVVH